MRFPLLVVALMAPMAAAAHDGVWQGTIGALPIIACLDTADGEIDGRYYYLKHLRPIVIRSSDTKKGAVPRLIENAALDNQSPAAWTLPAPAGSVLTGAWHSDGKALAIKLARVPLREGEQENGACNSAAFHRPREQAGTIRSTAAQMGSISYQALKLDMGRHMSGDIVSFQLKGSAPAIVRINAGLRDALLAEQANVFVCEKNSIASALPSADFLSHTKPVLITARWLVAESYMSSSCGSARPNYDTAFATWSLADGMRVDPWSWFAATGKTAQVERTMPASRIAPALNDMLRRAWRADPDQDPECKEVIAPGAVDWMLRPTSAGMAFTPSLTHLSHECANDVLIPYRELVPLMSAAGKAAVASLQSDVKDPSAPPKNHQ